MTGRGKHALGTSRRGDPRLRLGNFFQRAFLILLISLSLACTFLTFKALFAFVISSPTGVSFPSLFFFSLSLLQLLLGHFIPSLHHFVLLRLCLYYYNFSACSVISNHPFLYLYSLAGFSCVLVSHSTTQFFSACASSSMLLIFFNLTQFKVWWQPIDRVKGITTSC